MDDVGNSAPGGGPGLCKGTEVWKRMAWWETKRDEAAESPVGGGCKHKECGWGSRVRNHWLNAQKACFWLSQLNVHSMVAWFYSRFPFTHGFSRIHSWSSNPLACH